MAFSAAAPKRARREERSGAGIEQRELATAAVGGDEKEDEEADEAEGPRLRRLAPTLRRSLCLGDLFRAQHRAREPQRGRREINKEFSCVSIAEGLGADELLFSDPANDSVQRLVWSTAPKVRAIQWPLATQAVDFTDSLYSTVFLYNLLFITMTTVYYVQKRRDYRSSYSFPQLIHLSFRL